MFEGIASKALIGKIRSVYGNRVMPSDYSALLMKTSVSEVCEYLKKNSHYSATLEPYNEGMIHRGQLENLIERNIYETYIRLRMFNDVIGDTQIYSYLSNKTEIREILYCIQLLNSGETEEYINALPSYFISHASFDLVEMAKANTFSELLNTLKQTEYYEIMSDIKTDKDGKVDYSECESRLYNQYYRNVLINMTKPLAKNEADEISSMIKMNILMKDIIIVYRMRIFFNATPDEVKRCLIKVGENEKIYDKLIEASNAEEFFKILNSISSLKKYRITDGEQFSENMHRAIYHMFEKHMRLSDKAPVVFYSLFSLIEFEKENLTTIIEGIRYGVPQKQIEEMLIM